MLKFHELCVLLEKFVCLCNHYTPLPPPSGSLVLTTPKYHLCIFLCLLSLLFKPQSLMNIDEYKFLRVADRALHYLPPASVSSLILLLFGPGMSPKVSFVENLVQMPQHSEVGLLEDNQIMRALTPPMDYIDS